ncbi:thioredoxin reductase [Hamiltosporidium tvaerminnensis]|uniref:Thioredoxin reductase n=2 Tax=Hamiltosporidium TaxID=1176354 RepID=A0A4Q9LNA5_9MICR|nr:hypothetical protein LUQ84_003128 [Hamiltosporidium tvaerminnensis]TBU04195.1 thioredoxin reductase [Hamiltosporidium tvaerminnensis]TBU08750.1 thioredoxin reductase [Hamiltosporidium magnivora]
MIDNKTDDKKIYKLCVIGSGPAAYSACLYTQEYCPLLFEGKVIGNNGPGGQLTTTTAVDNYPGFPDKIMGNELVMGMQRQVMKSGKIEIVSETVTELGKEEGWFVIKCGSKVWYSECVIVATGAQARRLFVPGTNDDEYWQKGVSSCAVCDGWAYRNRNIAVIGGGDSAMEEAGYLSNIGSKVYLIHRSENFRARKDLLQKIENNPKVEILKNYVLESAGGNEFLEFLILKNVKTNEILRLEVEGLFFGIGHDPNTFFINKEEVKCDKDGYLVADEYMHTSIEGLLAAGDVQDKKYKQAITAAASGCIAGLSAVKFLFKKSK